MENLQSLLERVEAATGADVYLDVDIAVALGLWSPPLNAERRDHSVWRRRGINHYAPHTEVTASLDAALALVERVLPGWVGGVNKTGTGAWYAEVQGAQISRKLWEIHQRSGPTAALALLAAMLKALIAKEVS